MTTEAFPVTGARAAATLPSFNRLTTSRYGQMLYNVNDEYVGRSFELYGEFSEGEVDVFRQVVRPGDVVVEVGANIGSHTVPLAQLVGPGSVVAFEPQRVVFQTLCANVALNSLSNVFALQAAVGDRAGSIFVPDLDPRRKYNFGGLEIAAGADQAGVTLMTIDALPLPKCRLLKVDVEGMELTVLKGAADTIARHRPAMYVENDRKDRSAELIRHIDSLNYDMFWHLPPLFNPANVRGNVENVFGNIVSVNMICFPREAQQSVEGLTRVQVAPGM